MARQHAAAHGAGAACVGAALGASVTVLGLVQILSVALEENDEPEDQTEAEWATDRLNRLRLRSRQLRQLKSLGINLPIRSYPKYDFGGQSLRKSLQVYLLTYVQAFR